MSEWINIFWAPTIATLSVLATVCAIAWQAREQHQRFLAKPATIRREPRQPAWRVHVDRLHKGPPLD